MIPCLLLRIRKEEKYLIVHMPGYSEYRTRSWALIPGIY